MKNWFISLRDNIIPPYCYAKACVGKSKTELRSRYKKAHFVELPDGLHSNFEFRVFGSTITCEIKHGLCISATVMPDKGMNFVTYLIDLYPLKEADQAPTLEARGNPSCRESVEARALHENNATRRG